MLLTYVFGLLAWTSFIPKFTTYPRPVELKIVRSLSTYLSFTPHTLDLGMDDASHPAWAAAFRRCDGDASQKRGLWKDGAGGEGGGGGVSPGLVRPNKSEPPPA